MIFTLLKRFNDPTTHEAKFVIQAIAENPDDVQLVLKAIDYDNDGHPDNFIGSYSTRSGEEHVDFVFPDSALADEVKIPEIGDQFHPGCNYLDIRLALPPAA